MLRIRCDCDCDCDCSLFEPDPRFEIGDWGTGEFLILPVCFWRRLRAILSSISGQISGEDSNCGAQILEVIRRIGDGNGEMAMMMTCSVNVAHFDLS